MNLAEYQYVAQRTMSDGDNEARKLNAALGICGEAAEVAQAFTIAGSVGHATELLEESGDLLWYVALMCYAYCDSIENCTPRLVEWSEDYSLHELWNSSGYVADAIKKLVFHRKPIQQAIFFEALRTTVTAIDSLLGFYGKTLADACDFNNNKLLKRHANGFSYASANAYVDKES